MGVGSRICPERSLDFPSSSRNFATRPIGKVLEEVSRICSVSEKISKLDEYVNRLQDEMKKIYGFKRELPLCMLLLNDAIVMMKDELTRCKRSSSQPFLQGFIPLKKDEEVESTNEDAITNINDEGSWKYSLQLGNLNNEHHFQNLCFSDSKQMLQPRRSKKRAKEEIDHPLKITVKGEDGELSLGLSPKSCFIKSDSSSATVDGSNSKAAQTTKKQRRSWSPELHHRFVEALLKLGGARAATPRLIKENMAVEGLTLDQVKSHLQKYRIHTRKSTPSTTPPANIQPVGLGGLSMPQEPHGESFKLSNSHSGSPHGPFLLTGSSLGTSMTGGDTMEEEDDERSEIQSWKSQLHFSGTCVV